LDHAHPFLSTSPSFRPHLAGDYTVYNPYGNLNAEALGSYAAAGPNLGVSDYLYESSNAKVRTHFERSAYGAGTAYLLGTGVGVVWGGIEGMKVSKSRQITNKAFIRTNLLNAMGKRSSSLGNQMGVLGLTYGFINGAMVKARGERDDVINTVASGVLTGAINQATGGAMKAARGSIAGGVFTMGASSLWYAYHGINPVDELLQAFNSF
jgi:hypothetical protein